MSDTKEQSGETIEPKSDQNKNSDFDGYSSDFEDNDNNSKESTKNNQATPNKKTNNDGQISNNIKKLINLPPQGIENDSKNNENVSSTDSDTSNNKEEANQKPKEPSEPNTSRRRKAIRTNSSEGSENSDDDSYNRDQGTTTDITFETEVNEKQLVRKGDRAPRRHGRASTNDVDNNNEYEDNTDVIYRDYNGCSIMNYDPNDKSKPITDKLTLEAISNLSISEDDIYYPDEKTIYQYTHDPVLIPHVRKQLCERVDRVRAFVQRECERLQRVPPPDIMLAARSANYSQSRQSQQAKERKSGASSRKSFIEQEAERQDRQRQRNIKEAENLIAAILKEQIRNEEDERQRQREAAEIARQKEEVKRKRAAEKQRNLENQRKQEEAERQRNLENQMKLQKQKEDMERFEQLQKAREEKRKEEFERLEIERKKKMEAARAAAEKAENEKRRRADIQRREIEEREKRFAEKRLQEQKEREIENARLAKEAQERLEQLRQQQQDMIDKKRQESDAKSLRTEAVMKKFIEDRNAKTLELKQREEEKHKKALFHIQVTERKIAERKRMQYEMNEMKHKELINEREQNSARQRTKNAISEQIKLEEKKQQAAMMNAQRQAEAREKARLYDEHMKVLAREEAERRIALEKQERAKAELAKKKADAQRGDAQMKTALKNSNSAQITAMAEKWGLDINKIREKLLNKTRGSSSYKSIMSTPKLPTNKNSRQSDAPAAARSQRYFADPGM